MPFYEYECPACKYYLEVLQKISDKPIRKCPSCGKAGFKRLVSAPVFRLKGSGWYETDFKGDKDNKRNLAGADREEAKAVADDKTAAKPEAKPESGAGAETAKPAADKPKAETAAAKNGKSSSGAASRATAKRGARPAVKARAKVAKRGTRRR